MEEIKQETKEILRIDTAAGLEPKKLLEPLPVYNDKLPALMLKSLPFDFATPQIDPEELALRLTVTMKMYGGIGLSAVQCNILLRVFSLYCDENIVCFNPTILGLTDETSYDKEGCLSFPGIYLSIRRPVGVKLEWYDKKGERHEGEFSGLTARAIIHEMDHLEGILFTKYVGSVTMQLAKKRRKKMIKRIERQRVRK